MTACTTCPNCRGTSVEHNGLHGAAHKTAHTTHLASHLLHASPLVSLVALGCAGVAALFAGPAHTCRSCHHKF